MLLKHYLDQGVSKAELSRRLGVSRRTIHHWIATGQLDRDLAAGRTVAAPRRRRKHKLDPYKGIVDARLEEFPRLSAQRVFVRGGHRCRGNAPDNQRFRGNVDAPCGRVPAEASRPGERGPANPRRHAL